MILFGTSCAQGVHQTTSLAGNDPEEPNFSGITNEIDSALAVLLPCVDGGGAALTYQDETDWAVFEGEEGQNFLSGVFGDPDVGFAVVTKLRVLLERVSSDLIGVLERDPEFVCVDASIFPARDAIEVPIFGELPAGGSAHPFYQCVFQGEDELMAYGLDDLGVIRLLQVMKIDEEPNDEDVETRGHLNAFYQVSQITYAYSQDGDQRIGDLDFQYVQSTVYAGPDESLETQEDNPVFRSRSRVTASTVLESGVARRAFADFATSEHDRGFDYENFSRFYGRSAFGGAGTTTLFEVETDMQALAAGSGTYCLDYVCGDGDSLPSPTDPAACGDLEESFPWEGHNFPFELSPSLESSYEDALLFGPDDLIPATGEGFFLPDLD